MAGNYAMVETSTVYNPETTIRLVRELDIRFADVIAFLSAVQKETADKKAKAEQRQSKKDRKLFDSLKSKYGW